MIKKKSKKEMSGLELIREDIDASWAWFLKPYDEESMIASKGTNQKWFQKWNKYFDIIISPTQREGKPKTIQPFKYNVEKLYKKKEKDDKNLQILELLKKQKSKEEICRKLKLNPRWLGRLLKELEKKEIIKQDNPEKIKTFYSYPKKLYQLNLTPFFEYCESILKQPFTEKEKIILITLFNNRIIRYEMYNEYWNTNYIEAILKFYLKYFFFPALEDPKKKSQIKLSKNFISMILKKREKHKHSNKKFTGVFVVVESTKANKKLDDELNLLDDWTGQEGVTSYHEFYKLLSKYNEKEMYNLSMKLLKVLTFR